jgi:hypothetical protein
MCSKVLRLVVPCSARRQMALVEQGFARRLLQSCAAGLWAVRLLHFCAAAGCADRAGRLLSDGAVAAALSALEPRTVCCSWALCCEGCFVSQCAAPSHPVLPDTAFLYAVPSAGPVSHAERTAASYRSSHVAHQPRRRYSNVVILLGPMSAGLHSMDIVWRYAAPHCMSLPALQSNHPIPVSLRSLQHSPALPRPGPGRGLNMCGMVSS